MSGRSRSGPKRLLAIAASPTTIMSDTDAMRKRTTRGGAIRRRLRRWSGHSRFRRQIEHRKGAARCRTSVCRTWAAVAPGAEGGDPTSPLASQKDPRAHRCEARAVMAIRRGPSAARCVAPPMKRMDLLGVALQSKSSPQWLSHARRSRRFAAVPPSCAVCWGVSPRGSLANRHQVHGMVHAVDPLLGDCGVLSMKAPRREEFATPL